MLLPLSPSDTCCSASGCLYLHTSSNKQSCTFAIAGGIFGFVLLAGGRKINGKCSADAGLGGLATGAGKGGQALLYFQASSGSPTARASGGTCKGGRDCSRPLFANLTLWAWQIHGPLETPPPRLLGPHVPGLGFADASYGAHLCTTSRAPGAGSTLVPFSTRRFPPCCRGLGAVLWVQV